jgi:hypothetical protein
MWFYEEFEKRLGSYWHAANARGNRLLKIFFALLGAAFVTLVLLVMCILPKPFASAVLIGVLVGYGLLATYVVATGWRFHKAHGVFCIHCGASLLSLGETLEYLAEDGFERPAVLKCPGCNRPVVKASA